MKQSEIAEAFARKAHEGQFRRDGVSPYITHPARVVASLRMFEGAMGGTFFDLMLATAWLHDTMEDCGATKASMEEAGIDGWVIAHVETLTRTPDVEYERYLERIKGSKTERLVKVADIIDNLTDAPSPAQVSKYRRALLLLTE